MAVLLVIMGCFFVWLLIRYINVILAIRSLHMQVEELIGGSHMELGVSSRQKDVLALGRKLNQLKQHWSRNEIQYVRSEKKLKQNITSLAHDIRTPLTGAAGYLQLAQECTDLRRQERYLRMAGGRLRELKDMLEEMFLYTKLTSAEFELNLSEVQVLPLLSGCLVGFYREFEEKGIAPEVEFESEGMKIHADEECLRRIFHNLIQNALLHGRGGLLIRQSGMRLVFENQVSDTSRPDTEQIFEQFYKADTARRKGSSGLGLFIVKELTEKMGGSVKAELVGEKLRIILEAAG